MEHEALPQRERRTRKRREPCPETAEPVEPTSVCVPSVSDDTGETKCDDVRNHEGTSDTREASKREGGASSRPSGEEQLQDATEEPLAANYEYLDHTADIQIHSWGKNIEEAFEGAALAMFNYMTPLDGVSIQEDLTRTYEVQAHDMQSLLFTFLDELLFVFSTEYFVCCDLKITKFDRENWMITAVGRGETFHRSTHEQGTEVKAITYSAMQINEKEERTDVLVIVDI
eukprot:CAMPEP_0118926198 /NCGR_PEP_ID=MMETSP1169-20130426/3954_1 /TAXON_ID=36882 /ORGANISM="Pyramimonas obovata, Strain CCMP722" /LENGTH=228 /DNA_ID=CAMNT_0006867701 /DNA_START=453 /DNA_END=1139 /DNA_ORIENTATION=+